MSRVVRFLSTAGFIFCATIIGVGQCCTNGINLLANYNPDFSIEGDPIPPGFNNDNIYSTSLGSGLYSVVVSRDYGACFSTPQYDHTFGNENGDYLWFDTGGFATTSTPEVAWRPFDPNRPPGQENTIDVQPNTTYVFSVWIRDLAREPDCINGGAPLMGLRINGVDMAEIDLGDFTSPCCPEWIYLCTEWFSGNNTQAAIQIESRSGIGWTDLGIDDVYFGSTSPFQNGILGPDITLCTPQTIELNTNLQDGEFLWSTGETTSSIEVNGSGTFWVEVDQEGCFGRDSIQILINENLPQVSLGPNILACEGNAVTLSYSTNQTGNVLWSTGDTSNTLDVFEEGVYSITITNECGQGQDEIEVVFENPPSLTMVTSNPLLCDNDIKILQVASNDISTITWNTGEVGQFITVNAEGLYSAEQSNACGTAIASIEIISIGSPSVELGNDVVSCAGNAIQLSTEEASSQYLWNTGATTPSITVVESGEYSLLVSNECGQAQDAVLVTFVDPPIVELGENIVACEGEQVELSTTVSGAQIQWSTGEISNTISVEESGTYFVVVTNVCVVTDQISIEFLSQPILDLPDSLFICSNELVQLDAGAGPFSYVWSNGSTASVVVVGEEDFLTIQKSNICGEAFGTVFFTRPTSLVLPSLSDTTLCFGEILQITLDTISTAFSWENGSSDLSRVFSQPGVYTISTFNECDVISESFSLQVKECNCPLYVPNTITPNADGLNDVLQVVTACEFEQFQLTVFNRWGEAFFITNDPNEVWLATKEDYYVSDGIYPYVLEYQFVDEEITSKQGYVVVIR